MASVVLQGQRPLTIVNTGAERVPVRKATFDLSQDNMWVTYAGDSVALPPLKTFADTPSYSYHSGLLRRYSPGAALTQATIAPDIH